MEEVFPRLGNHTSYSILGNLRKAQERCEQNASYFDWPRAHMVYYAEYARFASDRESDHFEFGGPIDPGENLFDAKCCRRFQLGIGALVALQDRQSL